MKYQRFDLTRNNYFRAQPRVCKLAEASVTSAGLCSGIVSVEGAWA